MTTREDDKSQGGLTAYSIVTAALDDRFDEANGLVNELLVSNDDILRGAITRLTSNLCAALLDIAGRDGVDARDLWSTHLTEIQLRGKP